MVLDCLLVLKGSEIGVDSHFVADRLAILNSVAPSIVIREDSIPID